MYIQVFFPSGKYFAAEAHDPASPEWPPHPSRLFSALVASAYCSGKGISETKRKALEWLESLPPPAIAAPIADNAPAPVSYVPPGDCLGRKGKKGEEQYEHGIHRWRQPRRFPSAIILGEPLVHYGWKEDPEDYLMTVFEEICAGVTHVGTSHSMAVVKAYPGKMRQSITLLPDPKGDHFLRIPTRGRLDELDAVFNQNAGVRRPAPVCEPLASYRMVRDQRDQGDETPRPELLILRISGSMHGADTAAYLGQAVRRAVMSILGDEAPPAVHGHDGGSHLGWIPLPDVGHEHATGRIVGLGVALPHDMNQEDRREVLLGVKKLRELRLPDGRQAQVYSPLPGERLPVSLSRWTWTRPFQTWATVTPVVLDRPPKRLTEARVRSAIIESLRFAGYPEPDQTEVSGFSVFKGAPPAFRVPAKKPRFHAVVRFREPLKGPVIAGRLRYFGIGLFRPFPIENPAGDS